MDDELLYFYERERSFLLEMGSEFARNHPKIAGRLKLGADSVEDPHVSRLIESVALLNARIRKKLDDDFPEVSHGMLEVLYPQYLAPIPSMAIVQFECDPELGSAYRIPVGTELETDPIQGQPCRFRTAYPTAALPLVIETARLATTPCPAPAPRGIDPHASVLRISLAPASDAVRFSELGLDSLRFFLRGQAREVNALYELLFRNALEVAVASGPADEQAVFLGRSSLRPVGFDEGESMLPYNGRALPGYDLVTELFAFPHKFAFFEVGNLPAEKLAALEGNLELFVYFDRDHPELEQLVDTQSFALGCAPVVNLFQRRAEPIQVTHKRAEYRVVPDARRPQAHEVYSIDGVTATMPSGDEAAYYPFYGVHHDVDPEHQQAYYFATRRPAPSSDRGPDSGTEVHLSVVDLEYRSMATVGTVLDVMVTCSSRNLPNHLPFGGGEPRLRLSEGGGPLKAIHCLTAPTKTLRPPLGRGTVWRLVSQLSLNHLSLSDGEHGREALLEVLRAYDFSGAPGNRAMMEALVGLQSELSTMRVVSGGRAGVARGTEVTMHFDEGRIPDGGLFLFASVLERFLALYGSINTFTQLVVTSDKRHGVFHRWPPRTGERALL